MTGVLYVLRYFPTLTETFVYREMSALVRRGVPVHAVAIGPRADGVLQDEPPDVAVAYPPRGLASGRLAPSMLRGIARPEGRAALRWLSRHQGPKSAVRALWLADRARDLGVSRLHAHFAGEAAEWALWASRIAGVPFGVTVHAADLFVPRPGLLEVLRAADPVLTVAEHHRDRLAHVGISATVVRSGVDPARYVAAHPGEHAPLRVVSVARHVAKKGLDGLVAAARAAPADLRLVSDAPPAWSDARVTVGALPPSAVPAALSRAHLFALPCRVAPDGDQDGVPVAILEAMAAGLPVLTTPVAGIPEVVDDEVGWLVPPDDPDALVAALRAIAADPAERARRGEAARRRVIARGLTVERQADALLAAWGGAS